MIYFGIEKTKVTMSQAKPRMRPQVVVSEDLSNYSSFFDG
jgi:hypothetical protein